MNGPVMPARVDGCTAVPARMDASTAVPAPLLPAAGLPVKNPRTPLPVKNPRCTPVPTPDAHSTFRAIRVRRSPR